jgi:long-subunit fatty acid transport protein
MVMQVRFKVYSSILAFALFAVLAAPACGSGFAIVEQSTRHIGHSLAGVTAESEDPSAMFFNPASLASQE